jgi:flagellar basal-body rod protein FlgG
MQTGYYNAAAGMVAQFNRLDTIANNLANVNSAGFKQDNLVVGDFMRLYKEARDELPHENQTQDGAEFINRTMARAPQIVDEYTDFSVGSMQKTDNSLDFALSKEGLFFAVKTPNGVRLTRDGSFVLNDEGVLTTKQGYEVLPSDYFTSKGNIEISPQSNVVEVDKNGQITTNIPNTTKFASQSRLFIAQPDNSKFLVKEGSGLYRYDDIQQLTSLEESGAVSQGMIEKSNVNPVNMMVNMIETNRLVGMYQKVMDTQMNDMNRDAIDKIAKRT